jgi:sensor domain CHASE-containing protein
MTLRNKTLLIIGATLTGLFIVLYLVLSNVLRSGFERVEENFVQRNVNRAEQALGTEYDNMRANVADWAPWDDTYLFVQGELPSYIDDNIQPGFFDNLSINTMLFLNADYEPALQYTFDPETYDFVEDESAALSGAILDHVDDNSFLLEHEAATSSYAGAILLEENPVIIASHPILTNSGEGFPEGGVAIMARWLDDDLLDVLEDRARVDIELRRLDTGDLTSEFETALAQLNEGNAPYIAPIDGTCINPADGTVNTDCIAGYTTVENVYGEPIMLMQVAIPRDVTAQGAQTLQIFIGALVGVGLVFTVVTLVILERLVLSPVASLSRGVQAIGDSGNLSERLDVEGSDELAALSEEINTMLQNLQESLAREKKLKAEVQQLRIEIDRVKQQQQVESITESDFFQDLQSRVKEVRSRRRTGDKARLDVEGLDTQVGGEEAAKGDEEEQTEEDSS